MSLLVPVLYLLLMRAPSPRYIMDVCKPQLPKIWDLAYNETLNFGIISVLQYYPCPLRSIWLLYELIDLLFPSVLRTFVQFVSIIYIINLHKNNEIKTLSKVSLDYTILSSTAIIDIHYSQLPRPHEWHIRSLPAQPNVACGSYIEGEQKPSYAEETSYGLRPPPDLCTNP